MAGMVELGQSDVHKVEKFVVHFDKTEFPLRLSKQLCDNFVSFLLSFTIKKDSIIKSR